MPSLSCCKLSWAGSFSAMSPTKAHVLKEEKSLFVLLSTFPVQEFAENLLNSGVHGAVMVLDPTFNSEAMATALGIPSSKHMVRRHLVEEMKTLIESDRWAGAARKESPRKSPQWCHSFVLISVFTRVVGSSFGYSSTLAVYLDHCHCTRTHDRKGNWFSRSPSAC